MTNASPALRSLVVYAVILPVALVLGYLMAVPMDASTLVVLGIVAAVLCTPLFLRWERPLLFLAWNTTTVVCLLPGQPQVWVVMAFVSLLMALIQRSLLHRFQFLRAPSIFLPLAFLGALTYLTAKLTGGIGLYSMGAAVAGGRRYIYIFAAIAGFLAMTSRRIPPEKANLYLGLFFLGPIANAIGSFGPVAPGWLRFLFLVFPVEEMSTGGFQGAIVRLGGFAQACGAIAWYLVARYGLREMLEKLYSARTLLFILMAFMNLFGGFRVFFISFALVMLSVFYFEGLLRTKYFNRLIILLLAAFSLLVPLAGHLPMSVQRSLSFLPLPWDPVARESGVESAEWRVKMWKSVMQEVPRYLILGKGLAVGASVLDGPGNLAGDAIEFGGGAQGMGDYHSGPLTLLVQFGIFGVIGFFWLLYAIWRGLYNNYLYGDPSLKHINIFLLSVFVTQVLIYFFIFGGFYSDLYHFTGTIGMSVALNGGICRPQPAPAAPKTAAALIRRRPQLRTLPGLTRS